LTDAEQQKQRWLETRYQKWLANRASQRIAVEEEAREQTVLRERQRERDRPRRGSERPSAPTLEALGAATEAATEALAVVDRYKPELGFTEWMEGPGRP
jgi:hypothetical protein